MVNLRIFPQTALLFLIDSLRSTDKEYKLDLYISTDAIGGMLFELGKTADDGQQEAKLLFVENDLQSLMTKFMQLLQQREGALATEPSEAAVKPSKPGTGGESKTPATVEQLEAAAAYKAAQVAASAVADATGVPE